MITIQLAPPEELEDRNWYLPDVTILAIVVALSWWLVTGHLDGMEQDISDLQEERVKLQDATKRLSHDLKQYDEMNLKIKDLENKILSLRNITVSRIARFRPIIILEHLQNLKPEGIWFHSLVDDSDKEVISLKAGSFDNLLVAEFMSSLESTRFQEADSSNIRTQLYFSQLDLERLSLNDADASSDSNNSSNDDVQAAFASAQTTSLKGDVQAGDIQTQTNALFPELRDFPTFELRIKYQERKAKIASEGLSDPG